MDSIHGIQAAGGCGPIEPVGQVAPAEGANQPLAVNDVVEISTASRLAALIHEIPDVRADLVAQVRAQIEAGNYETPERIEASIDKLMEDLLGGI